MTRSIRTLLSSDLYLVDGLASLIHVQFCTQKKQHAWKRVKKLPGSPLAALISCRETFLPSNSWTSSRIEALKSVKSNTFFFIKTTVPLIFFLLIWSCFPVNDFTNCSSILQGSNKQESKFMGTKDPDVEFSQNIYSYQLWFCDERRPVSYLWAV